jgi:hypothetical protein
MPMKNILAFTVCLFLFIGCANGQIKFPTRRILSQTASNTPGMFYRFYVGLESKKDLKNNILGVERVYLGNDSNTGEAFFKFYFYKEAGIEVCIFKKNTATYECSDLEIRFKQKE